MKDKNMTLMEYISSENRNFFLADMATNGLKYFGYTTYEVYLDPQIQLDLAVKMDQEFDADFSYSLCDGAIFCETLGLELLKPDFDFPSVMSHPIQTIEDVRQLSVPDPQKDGRMPINLRSLELIATTIHKPLYVSVQGPFTLAVQLAGATHLLREIIRAPSFVKKLLEFTTKTVKRYAKAVQDAGAQYISISEPGTLTLSPENFRKFVQPHLHSIYNELDCWKGMHICGDTSHFLDIMISCPIDAISLDQIMDYESVILQIPPEIILIGNLDPIQLIGYSTPQEIRNATTELCRKMSRHKNYICAFGCNCLNDTPDINLKAAISTAKNLHKEI